MNRSNVQTLDLLPRQGLRLERVFARARGLLQDEYRLLGLLDVSDPQANGERTITTRTLRAILDAVIEEINVELDELRQEIPKLDEDPEVQVVRDALSTHRFDDAKRMIDEMAERISTTFSAEGTKR